MDQTTIATLFNIKYQSDVSRYLKQARDALLRDFVPNNLGPKATNRNELLDHNTYISKKLFNSKEDELILVADGTYCYCQKKF